MKTTTKALACLVLAAAGATTLAFTAPGEARGRTSMSDATTAKVDQPAPDFTLTDLEGNEHSLHDLIDDDGVKAVVLEWFNPGCPFVKNHYAPEHQTMNKLAEDYADDGVVWLRINSGGEGKQGAGLETNKEAAAEWAMHGPILLDESGTVGKSYGAKTTPHMYVIDSSGVLRYAAAIDDNNRARGEAKTNYVADALSSVLTGKAVEVKETRAYGCGVHYAN